ncbi:TenA family protein [Modestobacter sp. L9-4]|uniref:TenA family protein n=1 Tax=Modestobacter sp. L9-4 TaxID=2851567 RepID=UPI001C78F3AD|nr:TenA family protein [Modestobacter sp. L9-4]QXG74301.1 TenA family protein [Modestobacter sp. L9-4]
MSFTDDAWAGTAPLRTAIEELAFLTELGEGTLAPAAFRHYLEQDALYLAGYARALALLAARAPDPDAAAFWANSASVTRTVETALHADLLGSELLGPALLSPSRPPVAELLHSPTCLGYVSYLVATAATASYAVAAAAVLPCYWVYADTGVRLAATARSTPGHPYARWVATYDDPGFQESTRRARQLVDDAATATPSEVPAMHRAFALATRYELEFWRSAHTQETWAHPLG